MSERLVTGGPFKEKEPFVHELPMINKGVAMSKASALASLSGLASRGFVAGMLGCTLIAGLGGCDSFMNPSVTGRWEYTPTVVPVLSRIAAIEEEETGATESAEPVAEDLLPQASSYRVTPGDAMNITLYDMIVADRPDTYEVVVDQRGYVDLPQLGRIQIANRTLEQARAEIEKSMTKFVSNPLAQITLVNTRGNSYAIVGNVERAGQYLVPNSTFRLLEALTAGGRFNEDAAEIYVIRQVPLIDPNVDNGMPAGTPGAEPGATMTPPAPSKPEAAPKSGEDLINIINDITGPEKNGKPKEAPKQPPSPGLFGGASATAPAFVRQPESPKTPPPAPGAGAPTPPPVDLVEQPAAKAPGAAPGGTANSWVFLNGKWVQLNAAKAAAAAASTPSGRPQQVVTQRVIKIPLKQLMSGNQAYNIIVRPGDIIRVPSPPSGFVYLAGQISRPGPIQLPSTGGMTLQRAIDAGGGLGDIAIPERVDLTRMLGADRQATIRLNLRAIAEQTQPDVYLKPNDRINIGTNFWALPLAVIRNGFRVNYGWGLVIDRNFGSDVFGTPPEAKARNGLN